MKNLIRRFLVLSFVLCAFTAFPGCGMKGELTQTEDAQEVTETSETTEDDSQSVQEEVSDDQTTSSSGTVFVYVCGAVGKAGVYELPADARINDAVEAAGGMTKEAAEGQVNLAEPVTDGMEVKIPTFGEVYVEEAEALSGTDSEGRINLNTASAEQLMSLPGIGESKANAIISYRENNGGFSKIEDIMNISGIKEGLFEQIESLICV